MITSLINWLDNRTGIRDLMHEALYERVPGGARWRYVWGSTLVFTFAIQVITGFALWMSYSPSTQTAWESVYYIQNEMLWGWVLRGIHHFTAQAMIVLLALHLMQVVIDGAYKAPREVNFWLGLVLFKITLGLSLTGYLLPWDQKGYWATKVATSIAGSTPVVGSQLQLIAVGGPDYGNHTLTRFFALHAGILPALLVGFLVLHIAVFRRHGIHPANPLHKPDEMFWPDQVLKDAIACFAVLATILFLVWRSHGAELGAPSDPTEPYSAARPEWYFLFLFQLLKYFPGESKVIATHYIPGAIGLFMVLMPFVGNWKLGHRFNVVFTLALVAGAGYLTWQAIDADNKNEHFAHAVHDAEVKGERVQELIELRGSIPPEGAVTLLRGDSLTQGPVLFARHCGVCHAYSSKEFPVACTSEPSAPDLGEFGTRAWTRGILTEFASAKYFGSTTKAHGDKFTDGEMAGWVKDAKSKIKPEELEALIEFMASQSQHASEQPPSFEKESQGKKLFATGSDNFGACFDCHTLKIKNDPDLAEESAGNTGPDLTGYGSKAWLKEFISNPGHKRFYKEKNGMPAFAGRLPEREIDMIVEWMTRSWPRAATPENGQAEKQGGH